MQSRLSEASAAVILSRLAHSISPAFCTLQPSAESSPAASWRDRDRGEAFRRILGTITQRHVFTNAPPDSPAASGTSWSGMGKLVTDFLTEASPHRSISKVGASGSYPGSTALCRTEPGRLAATTVHIFLQGTFIGFPTF